jgi:hypothetical protein
MISAGQANPMYWCFSNRNGKTTDNGLVIALSSLGRLRFPRSFSDMLECLRGWLIEQMFVISTELSEMGEAIEVGDLLD